MAEKIYCTKCGREIKDGLLYCDRCGQSVKKSMERQVPKSNNRAEAERIHREQIERKKRRHEKEIRKQKNRRKASQHARPIAAVASVVILAVIITTITYISMSRNSAIISNDDVINDDIAKNSPVVTDQAVTSSSGSGDISFKLYAHNGISCPYPADFSPESASGRELLHLADAAGGATMTISQDSADTTGGTASAARSLMTEYYDEAAALGTVTENRSGSNWYIITYTAGGVVYHRKCVISDTDALYYDFEYEDASVKAAEYANLVEKLDDNFTYEAK